MTTSLTNVLGNAVVDNVISAAARSAAASEPAIEAKALPTFSQNFGVSSIAFAPEVALNNNVVRTPQVA